MKTVAVYALACPIMRAVFYVGLSVDPNCRLRQHSRHAHSKQLREWIAELAGIGRQPELFVLERVEPSEARAAECRWIEHYSRVSPFLLNSRLLATSRDSNVTRRRRSGY